MRGKEGRFILHSAPTINYYYYQLQRSRNDTNSVYLKSFLYGHSSINMSTGLTPRVPISEKVPVNRSITVTLGPGKFRFNGSPKMSSTRTREELFSECIIVRSKNKNFKKDVSLRVHKELHTSSLTSRPLLKRISTRASVHVSMSQTP